MIWITNKRYTPNGNNKTGFMYLSTKQSKEEQFILMMNPSFIEFVLMEFLHL